MFDAKDQKRCSMCTMTSKINGDDIVFFGEWLTRNDITVHYFCLLLSTHLPQRGHDNCGILGFLLRDIRKEIAAAAGRTCTYCAKKHASIQCRQCKDYFHLICGQSNRCLFIFDGDFTSYCHTCLPLNDLEKKRLTSNVRLETIRCYICMAQMHAYHPTQWIYGRCCENGFAHTLCMRKYALNAGYYLRCIWCKSESFRNLVKLQGVFVPDREANWETEKGAYRDLHRGHQRCDMETCNCPRGRQYISSKWSLINCSLCGSFGVHNPKCIPGMEKAKEKITEFKCAICSVTEKAVGTTTQSPTLNSSYPHENEMINSSLYVQKDSILMSQNLLHDTPNFSDDSLSSSVVTVIPSQQNMCHSISKNIPTLSVLPIIRRDDFGQQKQQQQQHKAEEDGVLMLHVYEFNGNLECLDKVLVKIHRSDPRFQGKTIDDIKRSTDLITENDIIHRTGDLSILKDINKIIEDF